MIAEVLVDVPVKAVDRTFDYLVPRELEEIVEIGQRVYVPFGPRFVVGYILGTKSESDFKNLKSVSKIIDIIPTLTKELIELGKNMRQSSISPLVKIYQAMLPSALKTKYRRYLVYHNASSLPEELKMLFLNQNKILFDEKLDKYLKPIKSQIKSNNVEIIHDFVQKGTTLKHPYLRLKDVNNIVVKGSKQKAVIAYLKETKECRKDEVMKKTHSSYTTIKNLIQKGIVEQVEKEFYRDIKHIYEFNNKSIILNTDQQIAFNSIMSKRNQFEIFLLHGVTGSGKTEIYLNVIEEVLHAGRQAIMLVPEISLTPMMTSRFKGRFKDKVALLHSGLSVGEKYDEWRKVRRNEVDIVVGARSAIFAPFENLGVVIIDEEHTSSYKQETDPYYHAKDVAIERAKYNNIPLILGSATPSVESYYKAQKKEFTLLKLEKRANRTTLPKVYISDMRDEFKKGNRTIFSKRLYTLMQDRLQKHEQIMLLLNRRGHSTFVMCRDCGETIMCPNCDISLTYHEKNNKLKCHYCGHEEENPYVCPSCGSAHIRYMGIGTEQVEEYTKSQFPDAKVIRMDTDTTSTKNAHEKLLYEFEQSGDILIGTQMIAKGLDFPSVTLVGVLAADMSLNLPDYQAVEKTFQLLTQVSGRAGRHDIDGEVVIQTYNPDHYAIKYAKEHNYINFYQTEMSIRRLSEYSPIVSLTQIIVSDKDVKKVLKIGTKLVLDLRKELPDNIVVLGPVLPKVARIKQYYRGQIIIKNKGFKNIDEVLLDIYHKYSDVISIAIDKHPSLL